MAQLDMKDLTPKDTPALQTLLKDEKERLFKLRFRQAQNAATLKTHEIREARRNIARLATLITRREADGE